MFIILLLLGTTAGLLLPWYYIPHADLLFSLYDFAEWTSLHPLEKTLSPSLVTPLLLRLQFIVLGALWLCEMARRLPQARRWYALLAALFGIAQLPPVTALSNWSDPNYAQQIAIAFTMWIVAGGILLSRRPQVIAFIGASAGLIFTWISFPRSIELLQSFVSEAQPGTGLGIYVLLLGIVWIYHLRQFLKQTG